ncbi:hypothetical protein ACFSGI_08785 [Paenibacillus nicotianae]|uniref:Post-transcriptional regulator n=1 Tax=Paenibacillus nicotianae TaxID=1526551 RepID=A0ABW4URA1_9BACL
MNNIHYMNWMTACNQRINASPLEKQQLDVVIKYENMRFWMELAKEVANIKDFTQRQFKYFEMAEAIPCQTKRFRLMTMARMEMHGVEFDTEKFDRYLYEGKM